MAGPYDFTGQNIENTYQRVLQTPDGINFYDGTGSLVILPSADTSSLLTTASVNLNTITFTKGDGSTFPITVDTGSGGPSTPTFPYTGSAIISGSLTITGSLNAPSITGSLLGTASWANSSSQAITASYALNGGVTQLLAGPNISLSPTTGLGQVTISSIGGGGFNTATGSYGSFYDTTTQTNVASTARSMSLNTTDISNGVSISGSTNPYNTYIKVENPGVYDIQFSAQVDKTDSGTDEIWIWLRKNGVDVADTATSLQLVGNGAHYVAAWNFFVNAAANDYFQLMWYSPDANVRLHAESSFGVVPGIPSLIVTVNRVDQFLSNTGSFSGSFVGTHTGSFTGSFTGSLFGTSSWAQSASVAISSSYALSASYAPIGPGATNTLALWNSTSTITNSSITYLTNIGATNQAVVSQSLYIIKADGIKIQSPPNTLPSSSNSNIFVNNISPAGNFIEVPGNNYEVIKYLDLYQYNINKKGGCFGLILDFNLMIGPDSISNFGDPNTYVYDENSWPNFAYPNYVETGRIYFSWLGADPGKGGAVGRSDNVTYLTMNPTITNAAAAGWEVVASGTPSATSLAASEEGVVAPYGAPTYRDQNLGYQFGYKLVNNLENSEWYVEVALYNDTDNPIRISHTTKILNLFTN